jgi:glutathione transport system permease protein
MTLAVSASRSTFALGMVLMQVFSVAGLAMTVGDDSWRHYVLPSLTLGAAVAAIMARFALVVRRHPRRDFIRTARAKGSRDRVVVSTGCATR